MDSTDKDIEKEVKKDDVKYYYAIRAFLGKIIPSLIISVYSFYVLSKIPSGGLPAKYLFKLNIITPIMIVMTFYLFMILNKVCFGKKNIVVLILAIVAAVGAFVYVQMPNQIINHSLFTLSFGGLSASTLVYALYYVLYAKTSFITANFRKLENHFGVFSRTLDSTDLQQIQDQDIHRSTLELMLGLASLKIKTSRVKEEFYIKNLTHADAKALYDYLNAHSFGTFREYSITRDRMNRKKKSEKNPQFLEDGDDEDVLGSGDN